MTDHIDFRLKGMREPRFDLPVLGIGLLVTGALSVGLATGLHDLSTSADPARFVPTSTALVFDVVAFVVGAAVALTVGSGVSAALARCGSRLGAGLLVGCVAYGAVLVPIDVATRPSDVSARDALGLDLILGIPLVMLVFVASVGGAALGEAARRALNRT